MKICFFIESVVDIIYKELELPCKEDTSFFGKIHSKIFTFAVEKEILEKMQHIKEYADALACDYRVTVRSSLNFYSLYSF